jgi:DNA-binding transcriptional LysR family regulator
MRCQHHAAASEVVRTSDLLATMTRSQASIVNRATGNQLLPFPIEVPPLESFLYWHSNVDDDPASQWFRAQVKACLAERSG